MAINQPPRTNKAHNPNNIFEPELTTFPRTVPSEQMPGRPSPSSHTHNHPRFEPDPLCPSTHVAQPTATWQPTCPHCHLSFPHRREPRSRLPKTPTLPRGTLQRPSAAPSQSSMAAATGGLSSLTPPPIECPHTRRGSRPSHPPPQRGRSGRCPQRGRSQSRRGSY